MSGQGPVADYTTRLVEVGFDPADAALEVAGLYETAVDVHIDSAGVDDHICARIADAELRRIIEWAAADLDATLIDLSVADAVYLIARDGDTDAFGVIMDVDGRVSWAEATLPEPLAGKEAPAQGGAGPAGEIVQLLHELDRIPTDVGPITRRPLIVHGRHVTAAAMTSPDTRGRLLAAIALLTRLGVGCQLPPGVTIGPTP